MDTLITETNGRLFLTNQARVIRAVEEVSTDLAAASNLEIEKNTNPFLKWILGDFVEADRANSNTQFWTKDDLAMGEYSIKYSPLNMLHKQQTPIGFFASTRTIDLTGRDKAELDAALAKPHKGKHRYIHPDMVHKTVTIYNHGESTASAPCVACGQSEGSGDHEAVAGTGSDGPAVGGGDSAASRGTAKIEALAGMWSHVFPFEAALVDQADELGSLFYSMECRGTHLHCAGPNGCDKSFDYMDSDSHCEHLKERTSIRHIVNPTFRGGALIVPPTRPGWQNASASVVQEAVREEASRYAEQTEAYYESLRADGGELTANQWEHLMGAVLTLGHQ